MATTPNPPPTRSEPLQRSSQHCSRLQVGGTRSPVVAAQAASSFRDVYEVGRIDVFPDGHGMDV
jgi:hypothetical protein